MNLHADATRVLTGWRAPDGGQEELRRAYLAHLAEHPDATSRTCRPAHLTASALVLDPAGGRVLLTLHPKVGRWLQLGGHCEPGDPTLAAAARRELCEESGIDTAVLLPEPARLDRHPVRCGDGQAMHLDVQYVALVPPGAVERASAESLDLQWFPSDALPAGCDASVRRLVRAALQSASSVSPS